MQPVAPPAYRPRRPHDSPLYKLVQDRFDALALAQRPVPQSGLGKAINYMLNLWPGALSPVGANVRLVVRDR